MADCLGCGDDVVILGGKPGDLRCPPCEEAYQRTPQTYRVSLVVKDRPRGRTDDEVGKAIQDALIAFGIYSATVTFVAREGI